MIFVFGDFRVDTGRFQLSRAGRVLAVEPQVLELLIMLIVHRDRVVSRDELLDEIWKGRVVSDTTLSSRIKTTRQAIGDDGTQQGCIKTIHGRGFRFVAPVKAEPETVPEAPAFERPVTRYARSGDIHVAYQMFGAGPVRLVLAPGFVSHIDNYWDSPQVSHWLNRLGSLASVAMFDKRGTGLSDRVDALPGMDERMDDLRAVMDAAGFQSAFVMGISEGGSLATLFAAHHPERCDGLILYGAFERFEHWFADEASLNTLLEYIESDWGSGKSLPLFAPTVAGDPAFTRWWGQFERLGAAPGAAIALMRMNSRIDITDVLIDVEAGRTLAERIPGAAYVELEGKDHLPWTDANADRIVDAVAHFLANPGQREAPRRSLATIVLVHPGTTSAGTFAPFDLATMRREGERTRATRVVAQPEGFAATFDGPARALECAIAVSRVLGAAGCEHRIGLHTGEIDADAAGIQGTAMAIASDVVDRAEVNEILASRTVNDLVAGSGRALIDRGAFELPTVGQAWHLFRVAI